MAAAKLLVLLAGLGAAAAAARNLSLGARQEGDELAHEESVTGECEMGVCYCWHEYLVPSNMRITQVLAVNEREDDGAGVELDYGGVGSDYLRLKYTSEGPRGFAYRLSIYAAGKNGEPGPLIKISLGRKMPCDALYSRHFHMRSSGPERDGEPPLVYERDFKLPPGAIINQLQVVDQDPSGRGAQVKLVSGGVGHDHVTLGFTSAGPAGINYNVRIFANDTEM